jgi:integrase
MVAKSKNNIRLSAAVARYLDRIKNEKQSETSQYTARYALARFQRAVVQKRDPDPYLHLITDTVMDDYFYGEHGISVGVKSVTLNRYRSVLLTFFRYAEDMRWVDQSPMVGIGRARPDMPVARLLLSATEMMQCLDTAPNPIDRIGLALGMNTGLRGNDIRHLRVFDVNFNNGLLDTFIRKTKKLDVKPITMELEAELRRYLTDYARMTGFDSPSELPNDFLLMPSFRRHSPRETGFYNIVPRPYNVHTKPWHIPQRALKALGYPTKGEGFHTLRRSSARALFESLRESGEGRDHALMIVQDFLNHSSTEQTQVYLGLSHERAMRDSLLKGKSFLPGLAVRESAGDTGKKETDGTRDDRQVRAAPGLAS